MLASSFMGALILARHYDIDFRYRRSVDTRPRGVVTQADFPTQEIKKEIASYRRRRISYVHPIQVPLCKRSSDRVRGLTSRNMVASNGVSYFVARVPSARSR